MVSLVIGRKDVVYSMSTPTATKSRAKSEGRTFQEVTVYGSTGAILIYLSKVSTFANAVSVWHIERDDMSKFE